MTRYLEGVPYTKYILRYTLENGTRRKRIAWLGPEPFRREDVRRYLADEDVKHGSNVIVRVA